MSAPKAWARHQPVDPHALGQDSLGNDQSPCGESELSWSRRLASPCQIGALPRSTEESCLASDLRDVVFFGNDSSAATGLVAAARLRGRVAGYVVADTVPVPLTGRLAGWAVRHLEECFEVRRKGMEPASIYADPERGEKAVPST